MKCVCLVLLLSLAVCALAHDNGQGKPEGEGPGNSDFGHSHNPGPHGNGSGDDKQATNVDDYSDYEDYSDYSDYTECSSWSVEFHKGQKYVGSTKLSASRVPGLAACAAALQAQSEASTFTYSRQTRLCIMYEEIDDDAITKNDARYTSGFLLCDD